ncbi:MAG: FHA domain-containing protein [Hyphomicrobium sp.]|nr:FHA domain-containing protein [Hyphomicrobium sp.]
MIEERGDKALGDDAKVHKAGGFLGSLKDALLAAGRDEMPSSPARMAAQSIAVQVIKPAAAKPAAAVSAAATGEVNAAAPAALSPSAEEAARLARTAPVMRAAEKAPPPIPDRDSVPTTRVVRGETPKALQPAAPDRTQLVRGKKAIERGAFAQDPVVGFLVVVGGPGLGAFRPVFEGNNTIGRTSANRVPLDFGDEAISAEAQAYIRYDSNDRSFLFVPNLAKTNVVSVNDKRPTGAVELKPMDVITLGRTQVAFVAFCGTEFDWSEIAEA